MGNKRWACFQLKSSSVPQLWQLWQWGAGNVYLLVSSKAKRYLNIAEKTHCGNGVVDTLGQGLLMDIYGFLRYPRTIRKKCA